MRWPWQREDPSYEEAAFGRRPQEPDVIPEGATRRRILFTGSVQGVGFRFTVMQVAERHHLTGWVKNLDDGDVLAEVQGAAADIDALCSDILNPTQHVWYSARIGGSEEREPMPEHTFRIVG